LTTIFVTILLDLVGFGMILPLLPFYAQEFGASEIQVGILFASYSLTQLLFAPPLGRLSDRVGRRPVLLGSIAASVVAYALFAAAGGFLPLLAARALAGAAAANYGIAQAYMADVSPPEGRARAMGLVGAAFGLGFILGPALGGLFATLGHRAVPLAACALAAVNLLIASVWLPESLAPEVRGQTRRVWFDPRGLREVWRDAPLRGLMLLFFLVMFAFSMMETTLALYCQARFGFGAASTSWLFVFVGIVLVVVQGALIGRLVRRFGERRLILGGIALMAAGLALVPATPPGTRTLAVLLAGLALLSVGNGVHNPSTMGLLSRLTRDDAQGGTIGLSRSCGALARILGPLAGTWVFGAAGPAWPFWTAGGLMLVALWIARDVLARTSGA
jgi:multidrug resistance protein